jgi:hypothetical protein
MKKIPPKKLKLHILPHTLMRMQIQKNGLKIFNLHDSIKTIILLFLMELKKTNETKS